MKELPPLGKFNYAKLGDKWTLDRQVAYMESYLISRKMFSTYFSDDYDYNDYVKNLKLEIINKYFGKVISLIDINDETTNEIPGQIVDMNVINKGVLCELILTENNEFRMKFLYLDSDNLIQMLKYVLPVSKYKGFTILNETIEYLFK